MSEHESIKIVVTESSAIIRSGLISVLKRMPKVKVFPVENASLDSVSHYLSLHSPDIFIVNPTYWGCLDLNKLKEEHDLPKLRCVALLYSPVDELILKQYDEVINIFDSQEQIGDKVERLAKIAIAGERQETDILSVREKEIISCVVKGLTNKEIANTLFLSTHTVITHRRNIARKLEIHSTAGLTVYAIANKLIEIEDIKKK
ncbi:MAG: LuxR C-terminal-related transcriptional regulator [Prevotellaceae bacterium]|jgi:DNA-binding NarL/FixJ family response regulator|nr:LuxR C-terminal-related transcriptional regulator [Prevotellaceae bacterium]